MEQMEQPEIDPRSLPPEIIAQAVNVCLLLVAVTDGRRAPYPRRALPLGLARNVRAGFRALCPQATN